MTIILGSAAATPAAARENAAPVPDNRATVTTAVVVEVDGRLAAGP